MAIDAGADFFISIHCNSNGTLNSSTGIETYYHMNGPSEKLLAEAIQNNACAVTGMCDRKARSDKQLYNTGLAVLRGLEGTQIPGVLIECGYVNNSSDRCKLVDHEYQVKVAKGIVAGLKEYIQGWPPHAESGNQKARKAPSDLAPDKNDDGALRLDQLEIHYGNTTPANGQ
jgi:N-acetylmuramoyl-L-alanine amidase